MNTPAPSGPDTSAREIVITRVIKAQRELVFDAFMDTDHISEWWGPSGFTTTTHESDKRVGGAWRFTMHGPDGTDYPNRIIYTEISPVERLRYDHDSDIDNDPAGFKVTITFTDRGNKTEIRMHSLFPTEEACAAVKRYGAVEGGNQTLQRLNVFLAKTHS